MPVLTGALKDSEPLIRAHAVWALAELLGDPALALFETHLLAESDPDVLHEIELVKTR